MALQQRAELLVVLLGARLLVQSVLPTSSSASAWLLLNLRLATFLSTINRSGILVRNGSVYTFQSTELIEYLVSRV